MRVATLTSPLLDFWVAKSRGLQTILDHRNDHSVSIFDHETLTPITYHPSLDWSQAGPILAEDWYDIETELIEWFGPQWSYVQAFQEHALSWFMRAYVATKFGEEVENMADAMEDA